jgi:glycosyltransferase involved in cell wall biosynthesis
LDLLIIAPTDYESLKGKSVLYQYENFREDGFFDNVVSFFPFTKKNLEISIDNNKFFYQYGWNVKFPFFNKFKLIKSLSTFILLFKILFIFPFVIKKYNIKIIRATDPYLMGLIGFYYSKLFKVPFVVSVHSDYDLCNEAKGFTFKLFGSRRLAERLEYFVYKKCNGILPISDYLINRVRFFYPNIDSNKFYKFPHGIEVKEFDNMEYVDIFKNFNISKDKKIICYVARLSSEKNCLDIPLIVERLSKKFQNFILLIIGDGEEYSTIQQQLNEKGVAKYVKLAGLLERKIVFNARKSASVNICLLDGYSLIEAGLSKRPVVAYDVEWHSDLIIHEKNGFLTKLYDTNDFSEKIYKLLTNEELSNILGSELRRSTIKNHEIKNTQKIKQNIYTKVIKEFIF